MSSVPLSSSALASILEAVDASSPALRPSSPSVASPFAGGGSWFSDPGIKWGPSLVLIRDHKAICGGRVGQKQNNYFCFSHVDDGTTKGCTVGKHAIDKHPVVSDSEGRMTSRLYYHKGTGKNVALAEPWVDADVLTSSELTTLLGRRFDTVEAWKEEALVRQSAASLSHSVERVRTALKSTKVIPRLEGAGRVLFDAGGEEKVTRDLETKLKSLGADINELIGARMMEWDVKTEDVVDEQVLVVRELVERIRLMQNALVTLSEVSVGGLRELQLGLVVRLASLEGMMGSLGALDGKSGFEGSTFAGAIEMLQEQLEEVKQAGMAKELVAKVMRSEDMLEFSEGLKEAFKKVMKRVLSLEEDMTYWKAKGMCSGKEDQDTTRSVIGDTNWFGDLDHSDSSVPDGLEPETGKEDLKEVLHSLARRMDAVEQNGGLNSKMEGEDISVFFMGVRFASERDVRSYVISKSHASFVLPVGLVTDCYSIFYELNREIFDSKNKLGVTDLAKVAQLAKKQADVYNILAGVEHGLPDFFDPPTSATKVYIDGRQGTKKHRFGNIPSYDVWGPVGSDGFTIRKKAKGVLARLVTTRRSEIKDQVRNEKLQSFLLQMLDLSKEFVSAVFSFLTEEYAALYQHFDDSALCWDFACSCCVEHVFKHEFEAARAVVRNPDVVDDGISIKILWQSLRTLAVQETFMRVGFKNHASLSSAYSKFLLTQYQKSAAELNRVSKEVEMCKKLCADMAAKLETVDKRARAADGTANAAQNALQRMKRNGD